MPRSFFLLTACSLATAVLVGCGSDGATESETPPTVTRESAQKAVDPDSRAFIDFDTMQHPTFDTVPDVPRRERVQEKPQKTRPDTPFERAIPFSRETMTDVFLISNPDILNDPNTLKLEACRANGNYFDMSKNEFSFRTFLQEAEAETRNRLATLERDYGLEEGEPIRLAIQIDTQLGDYDFDSEEFVFDAIPFDYLYQRNRYGAGACYDETEPNGRVERPKELDTDFDLYFLNDEAIQTLNLPQDDAKALIDAMTANANTDRNVKLNFVYEFERDAFSYVQKDRYDGANELRGRIVYAEVICQSRFIRRNDPRLTLCGPVLAEDLAGAALRDAQHFLHMIHGQTTTRRA